MELAIRYLGLGLDRAKALTWQQQAGWSVAAVLGMLLWLPILQALWAVWEKDPTLSHGPVVLALALGHLWFKRRDLRRWRVACVPGLVLVGFSTFLHIAAFFADIVFLKSLSLIGLTLGAIWYLGGLKALKATAGALGFLVFVIPWPTTLVERVAFPLQLMSSGYAAMFGGLLGLPIQREGIKLSVMSPAGDRPVYSVLVAQDCSGLTSLIVLLALGYLIAYHTPLKGRWKALFVATVVPLTLLANTVRITLILLAGTYHSAALAKWVHDHEAPILIFFCSLGLMALRQLVMSQTSPPADYSRRSPSLAASPGMERPAHSRV